MKPKIKDVAKVAGVSPATVSRVLNNRGYISEKTRENVYKAMKDINYFPNDLARSLFSKRTNLFGIIIPTINNPYFGELVFHMENICADLGYKVLLCNSLNRVDKEKKYWEMLVRNQVDGVIVATHNRGLVDNQEQYNLPIVAIDQYLSDKIPIVGSDNYGGGQLATNYLLEKGCRKIVHFNGPLDLETPANLRRKAYEDVITKAGRVPITYEIKDVFSQKIQLDVIERLFAEHPDVDGVFTSDDLMASTLLEAANRKGKDIIIVGYDGASTTRLLLPNLKTIQQPVQLVAETSIKALVEIVEKGKLESMPFETKLPVKLIT
ncbi:LacI family DNA-binding transcriptional regulator [Gracilibacillus alcaliphilus]|uniref:LacI family DNA-binding transcriptional regulator n=1 Tax=Gracilibacillus alcaliphilus TaxID=1401441 RepID=UPI00195E1A3A|nr:LacI family DNA-binding transcriptional regulator [Gracilibacillus alcaliphilus]MBM7675588.1 LacI family sucrose operon transcriptional repressor [Gracilibacillus alcaliphilus]